MSKPTRQSQFSERRPLAPQSAEVRKISLELENSREGVDMHLSAIARSLGQLMARVGTDQ